MRDYAENDWHWIFQTNNNQFVDVHEEIVRETGSYISIVPMAWDQHATGENGNNVDIGNKMLGSGSIPSSI